MFLSVFCASLKLLLLARTCLLRNNNLKRTMQCLNCDTNTHTNDHISMDQITSNKRLLLLTKVACSLLFVCLFVCCEFCRQQTWTFDTFLNYNWNVNEKLDLNSELIWIEATQAFTSAFCLFKSAQNSKVASWILFGPRLNRRQTNHFEAAPIKR